LKPLFIDKIEKNNGELKEFKPQILNEQMASPENIEIITQMLSKAVSDGTARNISSDYYQAAGKTGTARVEYWIKNQPMQYRASFAGFFPANNPKYTCVVVVHKPDRRKGYYGGSVTGPVFKKIADWVYSRTPQPIPAAPLLVDVEKTINSDSKFKPNHEKPQVPNVVGKSGVNVIPALENLGL